MPHEELSFVGSAADWLRFAKGDLILARTQSSEEVPIELFCFHAEQAVEKALKAVLIHFSEPVPRTHSIEALIDIVAHHVDVPVEVQEATELTFYAGPSRYPGDYEPVGTSELLAAIAVAEQTVSWASSISTRATFS